MNEFERACEYIKNYPWPHLKWLKEKIMKKTITKKRKLKTNPELLKDRRTWVNKGYLGKNTTKTS